MKEFFSKRYQRMVADMEKIVNIDSCSDDHQGVTAVAKILGERFKAAGLKTEIRHEGKDKTPCLQARTPGADKFDLMLLGHMDTVLPKGTAAQRPFCIKEGKAYGPGVYDMKVGLVMGLHLVEAMKESGDLDGLNILVAYNGDEETGSHNSQAWIEASAANCANVLVLEPGRVGWGFVMGRKGGGAYTVVGHGRAAHAGSAPDKGINALMAMAELLPEIHAQTRKDAGTTVIPTVMHSGDKDNVIPEEARSITDVRFETVEEMRRVDDFFAGINGRIAENGTRFEVLGGVEKPPMNPSGATRALWDKLMIEADKLSITPEEIYTGGCSDGNYTAALGVPTLDGMGGLGAGAHTAGEFVVMESLTPMLQMLHGLALQLKQG